MAEILRMTRGAELRPTLIRFNDENGQPTDLTGRTCTVTIFRGPATTAALTKTAVGGPLGMTVTWAAGDLDIAQGVYQGTATATNGSGLDDVKRFALVID